MWEMIRKRHGKVKTKNVINKIGYNDEIYVTEKEIVNCFGEHYIDCITKLKNNINSEDKSNMYENVEFNLNLI
jgi:hypothetical protein